MKSAIFGLYKPFFEHILRKRPQKAYFPKFVHKTTSIFAQFANEDNLVGYEDQLAMTLILKYGVYSIAIAIYQVILLVLCCLDSEQVENKYGASPKYIETENA